MIMLLRRLSATWLLMVQVQLLMLAVHSGAAAFSSQSVLPGHQYVYQYRGQVFVRYVKPEAGGRVQPGGGDQALARLQCQVLLHQLNQTHHQHDQPTRIYISLQLQMCHLEAESSNELQKTAANALSLQLTRHVSVLEWPDCGPEAAGGDAALWGDEAEETDVTNIKRAVVTMLQVTLCQDTKSKQSTAYGRCDVGQEKEGMKVRSTIDLKTCTSSPAGNNRSPLVSHLAGVFQAEPSSAGAYVCERDRQPAAPSLLQCVFHVQDSHGLLIKSRQTLDLIEVRPDQSTLSMKGLHRVTLTFTPSDNSQTSLLQPNKRDIQRQLESLTLTLTSSRSDSAVDQFAELSVSLRKVESRVLLGVWSRLKAGRMLHMQETDKDKVMKVYMDALVACAAEQCLQLVGQALEDGSLAIHQRAPLLYRMALTLVASPDIVENILVYCQRNVEASCLLPLGILTASLGHGPDQGQNAERHQVVGSKVVSFLTGLLGMSQEMTTPQNATTVVCAIKALANVASVHTPVSHLKQWMFQYAQDKHSETQVAVAAVQYLGGLALSATDLQKVIGLVLKEELDVEVRLSAASVMVAHAHADPATVQHTVQTIYQQDATQLKGYVASLVHATIKTTDQASIRLKLKSEDILSDLQTPPRHSSLSRAGRLSKFNGEHNISVAFGYDIVYKSSTDAAPSTVSATIEAGVADSRRAVLVLSVSGLGDVNAKSTWTEDRHPRKAVVHLSVLGQHLGQWSLDLKQTLQKLSQVLETLQDKAHYPDVLQTILYSIVSPEEVSPLLHGTIYKHGSPTGLGMFVKRHIEAFFLPARNANQTRDMFISDDLELLGTKIQLAHLATGPDTTHKVRDTADVLGMNVEDKGSASLSQMLFGYTGETDGVLQMMSHLLLEGMRVVASALPGGAEIDTALKLTLEQEENTAEVPTAVVEDGGSVSWLGYLQSFWSKITGTSSQQSGDYVALTFGRGHTVTFDGKFYEFEGYEDSRCNHILAKDYVHQDFTLYGNHLGLTLLTRHWAVTLHKHNYRVEVNNTGHFSDLPLRSWDGSVEVTRNDAVLVIQTRLGLSVACDVHSSQCLYRLDASYFNRTVGLLGSNDGLKLNDLRPRTDEYSYSHQGFVNSYELSGYDRCRPQAPTRGRPICPSRHDAKCRSHFEAQNSPLSSCFAAVDPQPYKEACRLDASHCVSSATTSAAICEIVSAYIDMCAANRIHLTMMQECGACGSHAVGSSWAGHTQPKLDLVLVAPAQQHLSPQPPSSVASVSTGVILHRLVHTARQALQAGGADSLHIALVTYGAQGLMHTAHVHTFNGNVFSSPPSATTLQERFSTLAGTNVQVSSNILEAVKVAAFLPFREDAVKMVMLVSKDRLPRRFASHPALGPLVQTLQQRRVQVDVVSQYASLLPRNAHGMRHNADLLGTLTDLSTNQQVYASFPRQDPLAQLSATTRGSLFDLGRLLQGHHHVHHTLQREVWRQVSAEAGTSRCKQCRCSLTGYGPAVDTCASTPCR